MPWPLSTRGMSNEAVPSVLMVTVIMFAVGMVEYGEQVVEVDDVGELRARGIAAAASPERAQLGGGDQGGAGEQVAQEAAAAGAAAVVEARSRASLVRVMEWSSRRASGRVQPCDRRRGSDGEVARALVRPARRRDGAHTECDIHVAMSAMPAVPRLAPSRLCTAHNSRRVSRGRAVRLDRAQRQGQLERRDAVGERRPGERLEPLDPVDHGVAVAVHGLGGASGRPGGLQPGDQGVEQQVALAGGQRPAAGPASG